MRLRRLALLAIVIVPVGVIWAACSVPSRPVGSTESTCVEGCPEADASVADALNSLSVTPDSGKVSDGPVRNVSRCGSDKDPGSCTPDPPGADGPSGTLDAISSCTDAGAGLSCQVVRSNSPTATAACGRTGSAKEGEACGGDVVGADGLPESDCMAGLACVRPTSNAPSGQCQRYCCFGMCDGDGYYCPERQLYDAIAAQNQQFVPVCVKGDGCTLLEPGSCPNPQNESPAPVCRLVADRITACDSASKSTPGQGCPCADGYVCLPATNTCRQICHLGVDSDCASGGGGTCVGGSALPPGFGLCVPG